MFSHIPLLTLIEKKLFKASKSKNSIQKEKLDTPSYHIEFGEQN